MTATPSNSRTLGLDPSAGGMSLPRLLFALLRQRFTGTLALEQPGSWGPGSGLRTVWLRGGMPVFTDWASDHDRLGDLLLARGTIDATTHERALRAMAEGKGLMGEILIELGAIDAAQRTEGLRMQCSRKLIQLFALRGGEIRVDTVEHDVGVELAPINVLGLIFRGVVAHYDRARIEGEMGPALTGDLVATPALTRYQRQFGFADEDDRVLGSLGRGVGFEGLLMPGVDPLRVSQIVYTLWASQMLRVGQDANEAIAKGQTAAAAMVDAPIARPSAPSGSKPAAAPAKPPPAPVKPPPAPVKPPPPVVSKPEPSPEPAPLPVDEGFDFEGQLGMLEAKVAAEANAFELFGLGVEADRKQIRDVWAELSKRFHPDALEGAGRANLRLRVDHVFAALSEAYGVLSDKDAREKLREAIVTGGSGIKASDDASVVVRNAFEAELMARDADKLLRGSSWERARDIYARAHELSPSDPDIEAALIYARHMARPRDMTEIRAELANLARLVEQAPACSRAFYFSGMIHLQLDEGDAAKLRFMDALRADPRNVDAERQLRGLKIKERSGGSPGSSEGGKAKPDEKKGLSLRGLFGKK
ncbi:DUF4388 domain-containing protein [Nannocystaceae bacterium ST9]